MSSTSILSYTAGPALKLAYSLQLMAALVMPVVFCSTEGLSHTIKVERAFQTHDNCNALP